MRKFIAMAFAFCLSVSLVACGGGNDTTKAPDDVKQTPAAAENGGFGYGLKIGDNYVMIGMAQDEMLQRLGEAGSVFEAPSCAGQGIDYTYTYAGGSVEITTVPNAQGVNLVDAMVIKDDLITTEEGVSLSMTKDDMIAAYGDSYATVGNACVYGNDGMELQFILEDDEIISIQYVVVE